jgi:hypothetical protein
MCNSRIVPDERGAARSADPDGPSLCQGDLNKNIYGGTPRIFEAGIFIPRLEVLLVRM